MITFFQKIFLPKNKLAQLELHQQIINLVKMTPASHKSFITRSGSVVREFSASTPDYNVFAQRTFDASRDEENQVQYSLHVLESNKVKYATHSHVDKFAKQVYTKMYKIWDKNRQNAK